VVEALSICVQSQCLNRGESILTLGRIFILRFALALGGDSNNIDKHHAFA